jgi:hypothetical protein
MYGVQDSVPIGVSWHRQYTPISSAVGCGVGMRKIFSERLTSGDSSLTVELVIGNTDDEGVVICRNAGAGNGQRRSRDQRGEERIHFHTNSRDARRHSGQVRGSDG